MSFWVRQGFQAPFLFTKWDLCKFKIKILYAKDFLHQDFFLGAEEDLKIESYSNDAFLKNSSPKLFLASRVLKKLKMQLSFSWQRQLQKKRWTTKVLRYRSFKGQVKFNCLLKINSVLDASYGFVSTLVLYQF